MCVLCEDLVLEMMFERKSARSGSLTEGNHGDVTVDQGNIKGVSQPLYSVAQVDECDFRSCYVKARFPRNFTF